MLKVNSIPIFIVSFFCLFLIAKQPDADVTVFNSLLVLSLFGGLFFKEKRRLLFFLSMSVYIIAIYIFTNSYIIETGESFFPGGDSKGFYHRILAITNGDLSSYFGRYKLFLFLVSSFYKLINNFNIGSFSPYHFYILSGFFASIGNVYFFKISRLFFTEKNAIKVFFIVVFCPMILKFSSTNLREVYAYPFVFVFIYSFMVNHKKYKDYILMLFSIIMILGVRLDWIIPLVSFAFFYNLSGLAKLDKLKRMITLSVFLLVLFFSFVGFINYIGFTGFDSYNYEKVEKIGDVEANSYNENSIAFKLSKLGVFGRVILFVFVFIVPFPPPIIYATSTFFEPLIVSLGAFYQYFNLPVIFVAMRKSLKFSKYKKITSGLIAMFFSYSFILSLTTAATYRHKLFFFPLMFLFIPIFNEITHKINKKYIYAGVIVLLIFLFILYLTLKS